MDVRLSQQMNQSFVLYEWHETEHKEAILPKPIHLPHTVLVDFRRPNEYGIVLLDGFVIPVDTIFSDLIRRVKSEWCDNRARSINVSASCNWRRHSDQHSWGMTWGGCCIENGGDGSCDTVAGCECSSINVKALGLKSFGRCRRSRELTEDWRNTDRPFIAGGCTRGQV